MSPGLDREDVGQVDLSEQWRPFESLAGGQPSGPALTKLAKLRISIAGHLPDNPQVMSWSNIHKRMQKHALYLQPEYDGLVECAEKCNMHLDGQQALLQIDEQCWAA